MITILDENSESEDEHKSWFDDIGSKHDNSWNENMHLVEMLKASTPATQGVEMNDGDTAVIKPGIYDVVVSEAELNDSECANPNNPSEFGKLIKMKLTITSGEYRDRSIFFINDILVYPASMKIGDQKKAQWAMAKGAKERKVILDSLGKTGVKDMSECVGAIFKAEIVVKKRNGKYSNKVSTIMSLDEQPTSAALVPDATWPQNRLDENETCFAAKGAFDPARVNQDDDRRRVEDFINRSFKDSMSDKQKDVILKLVEKNGDATYLDKIGRTDVFMVEFGDEADSLFVAKNGRILSEDEVDALVRGVRFVF